MPSVAQRGTSGTESEHRFLRRRSFPTSVGIPGATLLCLFVGSIAAPRAAALPPHTLDLAAKGVRFHPGVRGLALADNVISRSGFRIGIPACLAASDGSALRGVAGGLYADLYDWRTRNNEPRPTTLEFLRWARDHRDKLYITVNTRGIVEPDPANPGKTRYIDTSIPTLARMAADWVRYANRIAQTRRQGDTITDPRDRAILDSLKWSSSAPGDRFDTLPARGERPLRRVTYWEIGNEPMVSVGGGIGVSNGTRLSPGEYYARYKAITTAMKAEDRHIKVGPCITSGRASKAYLDLIFKDKSLPVDFVSYHPYQRLGRLQTPAQMGRYLGAIAKRQTEMHADIIALLRAAGRNPDKVEMVASEWFVSDWRYNEGAVEAGMAHALGSVETVFTFAKLGLSAAHYWIWIAGLEDGTRFPVTLAWDALRDHMGDTLIDSLADGPVRVYVTRDSSTRAVALWALNFSPDKDVTLALNVRGIDRPHEITAWTLGASNGRTTLLAANLSSTHAGGPKSEVVWSSRDGTLKPGTWTLSVPAATLTLTLLGAAR